MSSNAPAGDVDAREPGRLAITTHGVHRATVRGEDQNEAGDDQEDRREDDRERNRPQLAVADVVRQSIHRLVDRAARPDIVGGKLRQAAESVGTNGQCRTLR